MIGCRSWYTSTVVETSQDTLIKFKYSGRNLANNHDVIVVNFNYRLGLFGWLSHPSLNHDGSLEDKSGNFGILDSLAALEWVQNNIEAFGGDPTNVTLFGESAGGINIFAILASQQGEGLFHKANHPKRASHLHPYG